MSSRPAEEAGRGNDESRVPFPPVSRFPEELSWQLFRHTDNALSHAANNAFSHTCQSSIRQTAASPSKQNSPPETRTYFIFNAVVYGNLAPADLTNEEGEGKTERKKRKLAGAEDFYYSTLLLQRRARESTRASAGTPRNL